MFEKADILARLQRGDTIEDIAKEMTDALNDADKAYQESEAKRLEEQKRITAFEQEQKRIYEAKRAAVDLMLDAVCDYLVAAGEDKLLDEIHEIDTEKVIDLLDGTIEMTKSLEKLKGLQFPLMGVKGLSFPVNNIKMPTVKEVVGDKATADQALNAFLREFGL